MEKVFETLGAILTPTKQRCGCVNVEIGSYENSVVIVDLPTHMLEYLAEGRGFTFIQIDKCLEKEIRGLWSMGITTTSSCCGHNKTEPYIGVIDKDIPMMKALGYVVRYNNCRPTAEDSFIPQSFK